MTNFEPRNLTSLAIRLRGRRIGVINRINGDRNLFSFEQDYIEDAKRPTLSLSFKGIDGDLLIPTRAVVARLPVFFSNLLPEGHLRQYLAAKAGMKQVREFYLLNLLGADLPGAVTAEALNDHGEPVALSSQTDETEVSSPSVLRFSLAGVQLKFSAIVEAHGGLTIPSEGMGGSWIVKLPSGHFPSVPENEYAMLALARAVGIEVPQTKLIETSEIQGLPGDVGMMPGRTLAVQRFDRAEDGSAIHMEDFAQVYGLYPHDKYKHRSYSNIASVLWAETGEAGAYEFFRRLVFSVLIGNGDMHLKNWSLLYPDGRTPALSPAYDFVSTIPYIPNDSLALSFGDSRSLSTIEPDQVRRFAETARLPITPLRKLIVETAERVVAEWERLAEKDLLPSTLLQKIGAQIYTAEKNIRERA